MVPRHHSTQIETGFRRAIWNLCKVHYLLVRPRFHDVRRNSLRRCRMFGKFRAGRGTDVVQRLTRHMLSRLYGDDPAVLLGVKNRPSKSSENVSSPARTRAGSEVNEGGTSPATVTDSPPPSTSLQLRSQECGASGSIRVKSSRDGVGEEVSGHMTSPVFVTFTGIFTMRSGRSQISIRAAVTREVLGTIRYRS